MAKTTHLAAGTVTGYGLAAAQLLRFRQHNVRLVVCVDELAASGGYMMACCGHKILISPFAAVGSIGVSLGDVCRATVVGLVLLTLHFF